MTIKRLYIHLFLACFIIGNIAVIAQNDSINSKKINIDYTNKGFQFSTPDKNYSFHIESRLQFRFATPNDQSPVTFNDFYLESKTSFKINRARLKIGGNAYKPWLKYYFEYDIAQGNLLDFRIMIEKWDFFKVKVGQWKTYYSRERVISSGKQQMVDRSIINRPFTLDRQQGIEFYGRVFPKTLADFTYHISVLTGAGRSATTNDDNHLMYVGRLQWNMFGRELEMTGSDIKYHDKPTGILAFAAATNRSNYTRFSSAGGGNLLGYVTNIPGQYRVNQALIETAFKYRGFSWQNENHIKKITDYENNTNRTLTGYYVQAGYFFSNILDFVPKPLEIAGLYANYKPDTDINEAYEQEFGLAFNWFFKEHRNKLTAEVSHFSYQNIDSFTQKEWRFRIQWEISF
ncbi:Phosphate-selective porin O and P [Bizionia echini]|uniref:Phosphate-selective porin O and P n=1 Tax=Bizionia echini TaxID=649333 RepID=A0A1I5AUE3_9FLAO|nr:porin [Bizionia echini]SFN66054.1 Phosphate-selective porin O and P [Bizionia echini]